MKTIPIITNGTLTAFLTGKTTDQANAINAAIKELQKRLPEECEGTVVEFSPPPKGVKIKATVFTSHRMFAWWLLKTSDDGRKAGAALFLNRMKVYRKLLSSCRGTKPKDMWVN